VSGEGRGESSVEDDGSSSLAHVDQWVLETEVDRRALIEAQADPIAAVPELEWIGRPGTTPGGPIVAREWTRDPCLPSTRREEAGGMPWGWRLRMWVVDGGVGLAGKGRHPRLEWANDLLAAA
jgi:hypothetical protein